MLFWVPQEVQALSSKSYTRAEEARCMVNFTSCNKVCVCLKMLIACKKQTALIRKHKTKKVVNAIQNDNDVLCSTWDSVCFVLLANTCLAAAAHQY